MSAGIRSVTGLLALSTLAVATLAAGGWGEPYARPAGSDVRLAFGDRDGGFRFEWGRGRGHSQRRDVAPARLTLTAYQAGDQVIIIAAGQNCSGGFSTTLERCHQYGRPAVTLRNLAPARDQYSSQAYCGFEVRGAVSVRGCVDEITVFVAGRPQCVRVCRIESL